MDNKSLAAATLVRTLAQLVGNKVYLRDLEQLLSKLELSPHDEQTLLHLVRDLKSVPQSQNNRWRF